MGKEKIAENIQTTETEHDIFMPNISVDCVIFGFHQKSLKVLLYKGKGASKWMLPWGFVKKEEDVDEAALNVLKDRTGLRDVYLKQFHLFGNNTRGYFEDSAEMIKLTNFDPQKSGWDHQRCLSLGYYALIKYDDVNIRTEEDESTDWFAIDDLPVLYADHKEQVGYAVNFIKQQLGYVPIGFELLPEKFTLPELRSIYEAILGKDLDRRNFQRKMLAAGIIIPTNETRRCGAHKSPNLYKFDQAKYDKARKFGLHLVVFKFK